MVAENPCPTPRDGARPGQSDGGSLPPTPAAAKGVAAPLRARRRPVHQHRRFHGRDAAGAATETEAGHRAGTVRLDRRVLHPGRGAGGAAGLVVSRSVRAEAASISASSTGFLVGTLLCGLSFNYGSLLAARIVTGAFGGILGGMALAIIGDVFPEERRGQATGILMSAFALASVVGVPLCLSLGTRFGWHVPFLLLAAFGTDRARTLALRFCLRCATTSHGHDSRPSLDAAPRDLQPRQSPQGVRLHLRDHVRRLLGHSLHQPLPRLERRGERGEPDLGLRGRRTPDPGGGSADRPPGGPFRQAAGLSRRGRDGRGAHGRRHDPAGLSPCSWRSVWPGP